MTSYDPKKIRINKKVQEFYQGINIIDLKETTNEEPNVAKETTIQAKETIKETKTIKLFNLSEYEYKNK